MNEKAMKIKKILATYAPIRYDKYSKNIEKHDKIIAKAKKKFARAIAAKEIYQEEHLENIDKSVKDLDGISNE